MPLLRLPADLHSFLPSQPTTEQKGSRVWGQEQETLRKMGGVSCPQFPVLPLMMLSVGISPMQEAKGKMQEVAGCAGA